MRGHTPLQTLLEHADEVCIPATVLGELYAGFHAGSRAAENVALLGQFRRQPGVSLIDITDNVAERYGALVATLRGHGTPIPTNDIWIAAAAWHYPLLRWLLRPLFGLADVRGGPLPAS
jgi:predicted nucleic acid-binding protein